MANEVERITDDGEIISGLPAGYGDGNQTLAVSLARAEIDQQIATARALPRSISRTVGNILSLATIDEQSAEECIYALPRGSKPIKGPSIRLAEIIASQWGNCRVGARVVHVDYIEKWVEAEGVFHDLESNTATTARVRRRISDKKGNLLSSDMIIVTGNAACSIAKRNAILGGVPRAVWRRAYDQCEAVITGDQATLTERRDKAFKAFGAFGVKPEQIFTALEIGGIEEITLEHMVTLTGMHSALKSGEANVEEMFPRKSAAPAEDGGKARTTAEQLDKVAAGGKAQEGNGGKAQEEIKVTSGKQPAKDKPPEDPQRGSSAASNAADRIVDQDGKVTKDKGKPADDDGFPGDKPFPSETKKKEAEQAASGGAERDDGTTAEDPGVDKPREQSPLDIAYDRGWQAQKDGVNRRGVPGEYRTEARLPEAKAWTSGYDDAAKDPSQ